MIADIILAIDVGTSYVKAALLDRDGRLLGRAAQSYTPRQTAPGSTELDPEIWIEHIASTVGELTATGIDLNRLAGIGLSARGELAIFLDEAGRVLTPAWLDRRAMPAVASLAAKIGEDTDYYQSRWLASKTYHLRQTAPDLFARLDRPVFVRDFIQYRLTDTIATDPSSGPPDGIWSARHWDAVGFPVEKLAPVRPHTDLAGWLTPAAADRLGLPMGLPVGVGGHDGACANAGAGAIRSGQVCLTFGTRGVARAVSSVAPTSVVERRIYPFRFLPGRWCYSEPVQAGGSAPTLVASVLAGPQPTAPSNDALHAELSSSAQAIAPGSGGVLYLPFPSGQISPQLRLDARAAFLGMSADTTRAHLYRASLEGVAFAFRSVVERHRENGLSLDDYRLSGGGARNTLWVQLTADVLRETITVVEDEEGLRGAAMFLAVALGWFDSPEAAAEAWVRKVRTAEPSRDAETYEPLYRRYRRLVDAVYEAERTG